jgi:hypothetical protein
VRSDNEEVLNAIRREYEILKEIEHGNIVQAEELIFDVFRSTLYLVMQLFEG